MHTCLLDLVGQQPFSPAPEISPAISPVLAPDLSQAPAPVISPAAAPVISPAPAPVIPPAAAPVISPAPAPAPASPPPGGLCTLCYVLDPCPSSGHRPANSIQPGFSDWHLIIIRRSRHRIPACLPLSLGSIHHCPFYCISQLGSILPAGLGGVTQDSIIKAASSLSPALFLRGFLLSCRGKCHSHGTFFINSAQKSQESQRMTQSESRQCENRGVFWPLE